MLDSLAYVTFCVGCVYRWNNMRPQVMRMGCSTTDMLCLSVGRNARLARTLSLRVANSGCMSA